MTVLTCALGTTAKRIIDCLQQQSDRFGEGAERLVRLLPGQAACQQQRHCLHAPPPKNGLHTHKACTCAARHQEAQTMIGLVVGARQFHATPHARVSPRGHARSGAVQGMSHAPLRLRQPTPKVRRLILREGQGHWADVGQKAGEAACTSPQCCLSGRLPSLGAQLLPPPPRRSWAAARFPRIAPRPSNASAPSPPPAPPARPGAVTPAHRRRRALHHRMYYYRITQPFPPAALTQTQTTSYWYSSPSTSTTPAAMVARLAARRPADPNLCAAPVLR